MRMRPFNEEDYDLDGLREVIAADRWENLLPEYLEGMFDSPGTEVTALLDAMGRGDTQAVGAEFLRLAKAYVEEGVTDDDCVREAYDIHVGNYELEMERRADERREELRNEEGE